MRRTAELAALAAGCALAACAATANPTGNGVLPAVPEPRPAAVAAAEPSLEAAAAQPQAPAQQDAPEQPARPAAQEPTRGLVIGSVGGESIHASALLERLWMRDSETARELFEFLVMSRIALMEAERLGVRIDPNLVDTAVLRTLAAVTERLRQSGSGLTLDQHIQRTLEISRANYDRKVRADAVLQLLTERCVRAWFLENPRVEIQLAEFDSDSSLEAAMAALATGQSLEEVARLHGLPEDAESGGMRMTVVRNEESDLARLAFVTGVGEVGGPLLRDQHFLLLQPVNQPAVVEGVWAEVGPAVEASLAEIALDADKMEYVQWRAAMVRRYPVDLEPFLDVVQSTLP